MHDNIVPPISMQIRERRRELGLTLEEVATRAGTSAPTMHRYETGWDRFEIRTLRRIGVALEADVEVRLVPRSSPTPMPPTAPTLISLLAPLFWDSDLQPPHLERYPAWVFERVLVFGNRDQVAATRSYFGDAALAAALERRGIDARTRNYWHLVLEDECIPAF